MRLWRSPAQPTRAAGVRGLERRHPSGASPQPPGVARDASGGRGAPRLTDRHRRGRQLTAVLYLASDGIAQREAGNRLGWQGRRGVR